MIACVSVGIAALLSSTTIWAQLLFGTVVASLLLAVVGALFQRGAARASCVGFVVFGSAYLLLVYIRDTHYLLPTKGALDRAHGWVLQLSSEEAMRNIDFVSWNEANWTAFEAIGHLLFTFVIAWFGALAARYFFTRSANAN